MEEGGREREMKENELREGGRRRRRRRREEEEEEEGGVR